MNDESSGSPKRRIIRGLTVVALLLVVSGACYGAYRFIGNLDSGPKKHIVEVVTLRLIQPPPPPPPPPPPVQKPPEPAKMMEQPKEAPDKPKAAEKAPQPLALDAKAGPGSDGFGLGGRPGGQSLIGGDGGGGNGFARYANMVQQAILDAMSKDEKLHEAERDKAPPGGRYQMIVAVWVSSGGRADRVQLLKSGGAPEIDQRFEQMLSGMQLLSEAPPHDMPQPINLSFNTR